MNPRQAGGTEEKQRLFIALPMAPEAREALRAATLALPGGRPPGRLVPPRNWHWTLRFLGSCSARRAAALGGALERAELGPTFDLAIGKLGAFPSPRRARVLWAGPATEDQVQALHDLAARVDRAVAAHAPPRSERRSDFHAHLTLSRLRPSADVRAALAAWRVPSTATQLAHEVCLYRSRLGQGPPRYEVVARRALDRVDSG